MKNMMLKTCDIVWHFTAPRLTAWATSVFLEDLPTGLEGEPILLTWLARITTVLWAIFLLAFGRKFDRVTVGTFFGVIGLLLGMQAAATINYLLAAIVSLLIFGVGMAVYIYRPRLGMGVAHLWPFVAIYFAYLYFTGSFDLNRLIAISLVILGVVTGIVLPRSSLAIVASALGTMFLAVILPIKAGFVLVLVIFIAGVLWQVLLLPKIQFPFKWWDTAQTASQIGKARQWLHSLKWGAAILFAGAVVLALLAPQPEIASAPHPLRLQTLAQNGGLDRPGFIFSAEDNYYLFGRALPVALAAKSKNFRNRFAALFTGKSPSRAIRRLRAVKDEIELEKLRRAAAITSLAFEAIAPLIRPGINEAAIEKRIHEVFRENGATGRAFECVVGSGANATRPHYRDNNAMMSKGLVVIDIGCSVDKYASDMTRTFPVAGKFTAAARRLVDIVIAAGDSARAYLRAGATMRDLHRLAKKVISEAGFGQFFKHFVGHHVGLNVHDSASDTLAAGMVITIEPGIYIPAGAPVDSAYWDLGVRIEDTYIVTENGYEEITHFPRMK